MAGIDACGLSDVSRGRATAEGTFKPARLLASDVSRGRATVQASLLLFTPTRRSWCEWRLGREGSIQLSALDHETHGTRSTSQCSRLRLEDDGIDGQRLRDDESALNAVQRDTMRWWNNSLAHVRGRVLANAAMVGCAGR